MKAARICTVMLMVFVILTGFSYASEETFRYGRFGTVTVYRESPRPSHVVLFVSGDGGWNLGVIDMAKALASLDALVAGIDITRYLKEITASSDKCSYPAADLESLSMFIQKKYGFSSYTLPVLVGYSSGATLVYASLVQSPPGTFKGAISLGFCPDLPLTKPLCRGSGLEWKHGEGRKGYSFLPAKGLSSPWITFQGEIDQVCNASMVEAYVKQVKEGELVLLPRVGHGFSVQKNWMPRFRKTFANLVKRRRGDSTKSGDTLKDLPLIEVPSKIGGTDIMAVIVSGDGGWAGIDREIGGALAAKGVPVVGLNSLEYFWKGRSPEEASRDLERILRHYIAAWDRKRTVLIGYSLGADVLPFMINGLSRDMADKVSLAVLLGPGREATFEFHLTYWLGGALPRESAYPLLPEVRKMKGIKVLCLYGESEDESVCRDLNEDMVKTVALKGGHHFAGEYVPIADIILNEVR